MLSIKMLIKNDCSEAQACLPVCLPGGEGEERGREGGEGGWTGQDCTPTAVSEHLLMS